MSVVLDELDAQILEMTCEVLENVLYHSNKAGRTKIVSIFGPPKKMNLLQLRAAIVMAEELNNEL